MWLVVVEKKIYFQVPYSTGNLQQSCLIRFMELLKGISTFLVTQPLFADLTDTVCSLGPEEY